jgi:hypothetical protein
MRLEQRLAGLEALRADLDHTTVGQGVGGNKDGGLLSEPHLALCVVANVAQLLFDLSHLQSV